MKRIFAIVVAIMAISSLALAQMPTLPDYQKDGRLAGTWLCDSGKTTVKGYKHKEWFADETRTSSGWIFVESSKGFYMQAAGSTEMKKVSHPEWDAELQKQSLSVYNDLHGSGPTDCKQQ